MATEAVEIPKNAAYPSACPGGREVRLGSALTDIYRSPSSLIRVTRTVYAGQERVDAREWYADTDGGLRPTRKGLSLTIEQARQLMAALAPALEPRESGDAL